jgi:type I restriction enzyme M protein
MAKRICFVSRPERHPVFEEIEVEFKYYTGFAVSQKQKSIFSMHERIYQIDKTLKVLEISTKSPDPIGVALSAFNLKFVDISGEEYAIENIFQSSKVFEKGGPYKDLLYVHPRDAKRDERLQTSGRLKCFNYDAENWDLEPKTMFYDWIYVQSLFKNKDLSKKILEYNAFTDIEFNSNKSINCQARSAAIFVSLSKKRILEEAINNKETFKELYSTTNDNDVQLFLFDN